MQLVEYVCENCRRVYTKEKNNPGYCEHCSAGVLLTNLNDLIPGLHTVNQHGKKK